MMPTGVVATKDGDSLNLNWCLIDEIWQHDPDVDAQLESTNPFGPVREKIRHYGANAINQLLDLDDKALAHKKLISHGPLHA